MAVTEGAVLMYVIAATARVAEFERAMRRVSDATRDARANIRALVALAAHTVEPVTTWENEGGAL